LLQQTFFRTIKPTLGSVGYNLPKLPPNSAITVEKLHQEKAQQEKLKAVKARLNFKEASRYSESETPNRRRNLKERLGPRLGDKWKNVPAHSRGSERKSYYSSRRDTESCYQSSRSKESDTAFEKHHHKREYSRRTKAVSESEGSARGHWKSKQKKQKSSMEDDLSQPWAMPTWCHMFNSTLTGNARVWFDDLPKESIDSYDDLRKAFLKNYLQQKKCIKDPIEIHNIKQRDGESTEEFVRRYKLECRDRGGSGLQSGKEEVVSILETGSRIKAKLQKGKLSERTKDGRKQDKFTLLTKTPREILALDKGKFKPSPPMTTPVEKRNLSKFYKFHGEVWHTTEECMHLKRQIEEMLKAEQLSHLIKELKQNHGKDQTKITKKGKTSWKDKPLVSILRGLLAYAQLCAMGLRSYPLVSRRTHPDRGTPGSETIEHFSGMILLLCNVTISTATGILSFCAPWMGLL
nr:reverse transcriptase domain-containing protein [Tanacetum cinerariifolium]